MRISVLEDYGLRCLSQLARVEGRRLTIGTIAQAEGLTEENAAKVLARLRDAGLVQSFRGKDGGYILARPAADIVISDVLGDIGGRLFEVDRCQGGEADAGCVHHDDCGIRPVWVALADVVHSFLSSITLADLVQTENAVCERIGEIVESLEMPNGATVPRPRPLALAGSAAADETVPDGATSARDLPTA